MRYRSFVTGLGQLHFSHFCPATQHRPPYASAELGRIDSETGRISQTRSMLTGGLFRYPLWLAQLECHVDVGTESHDTGRE